MKVLRQFRSIDRILWFLETTRPREKKVRRRYRACASLSCPIPVHLSLSWQTVLSRPTFGFPRIPSQSLLRRSSFLEDSDFFLCRGFFFSLAASCLLCKQGAAATFRSPVLTSRCVIYFADASISTRRLADVGRHMHYMKTQSCMPTVFCMGLWRTHLCHWKTSSS